MSGRWNVSCFFRILMRAAFTICSSVLLILLLQLPPTSARPAPRGDGAEGKRCRACHVGGEADIPQIDPDLLDSSAHSDLSCEACHPEVTVPHLRELPTVQCGICHSSEDDSYRRSVHWREQRRGVRRAPRCVTCHGSHGIRFTEDSASSVNRTRVAATCGECHEEERLSFEGSIHHEALEDEGLRELAPSCSTCHGGHKIYPSGAPASPVSGGRLPGTCGGCHDDPRMAERAGIPGRRLVTYSATIHGLRNRFGVESVADCADCHGVHKVLPADDPDSSVAPENLVETCGQCHANANENFVQAKIHVEASPESSIGVFVVRWFYIIFIGILGVGFVTHIIFDLIMVRRRRREERYARK